MSLYHRFHDRFGTAGVVLGVIALVLSLSGGAFAASKALTKSQVKKIAKEEAKKYANSNPGAPGAPGSPGKDGTNGTNGTNGTDGVSVTGTAASVGECPNGGVKYASASGDNTVCNGEDGTTGFTDTLPPGKTETGTWAVGELTAGATPSSGNSMGVPLSFAIPLSEGLGAGQVHFINEDGEEVFSAAPGDSGTSTACTGSVEEPTAEQGNLCVYMGNNAFRVGSSSNDQIFTASVTSSTHVPINGTNTAGAVLKITFSEPEAVMSGTWAVTEEE
jgi:hypothetical protein